MLSNSITSSKPLETLVNKMTDWANIEFRLGDLITKDFWNYECGVDLDTMSEKDAALYLLQRKGEIEKLIEQRDGFLPVVVVNHDRSIRILTHREALGKTTDRASQFKRRLRRNLRQMKGIDSRQLSQEQVAALHDTLAKESRILQAMDRTSRIVSAEHRQEVNPKPQAVRTIRRIG